MRWQLLILPGAAMLAAALALPPGARDIPPTSTESLAQRLEVARLRAHFDSVDTELRARHPLLSTPGRRTARDTLIGWLREYRDAGTFPRNDRFPGQAVPFFRDSRGVLCAMAYLIDRSGRGDLVDRVALTRNNAFIPELADDSELRAWLDSVHLSVAEAARIQPSYGDPTLEVVDDQVSADYALASILVSGASLTTVALNLINPSKSTGWAGLAAGSVGLIAGVAKLDETGGTDKVAAANMIIGGGAMAAGLYHLLSRQSPASNQRVAISPLVIPTSGRPSLGVSMQANF